MRPLTGSSLEGRTDLATRARHPILVTGAHRSGSTFVGRILSVPRHIGYIPEPFSMLYGLDWIDLWYLHLHEGMRGEAEVADRIGALLSGRACYKRTPRPEDKKVSWRGLARCLFRSRNQFEYWSATRNPRVERYLIKDPLASLSSEYLHRKFGMDVVVLVRHPAAFVASMKRAIKHHWRPFNFKNFLEQPRLMKEHMGPILAGRDLEALSIVENAALQWVCIYSVLATYVSRNREMILVRHEDLSSEPLQGFRNLFASLGIPWEKRVERRVIAMTHSRNPVGPVDNRIHSLKRDSVQNITRWKQVLTDDEVECTRKLTASVAERYYSPSEW